MQQAELIRRQYDEVIASHYDFDPQSMINDSLEQVIEQFRRQEERGPGGRELRVLDLGVGTGLFLEKMRAYAGARLRPFGLDLSERMIEIACARLPDLVSAVDNAANVGKHFAGQQFDLISTHFITGFVPMDVLAPQILAKLAPGGYWSFAGGTKGGFPVLQRKASGELMRSLVGAQASVNVDDMVCNPDDEAEVVQILERHGFDVQAVGTFAPPVHFKDFDEFMEFAYYGGWLTPFVEKVGLHDAAPVVRGLMNDFFFPVKDAHEIVLALAQKRA